MKKYANKTLIFLSLICLFPKASVEANVFESGSASKIYVDAEFLYWKAQEDGLPFAADGLHTLNEGNVHEVNWSWDPGYRIGAGFLFGCESWDLSLTYTWFRTKASDDFSGLSANSVSVFEGIPISSANANWKLRFQTLDLSLSKSFCFCERFSFAPVFAIRSAFIRDTYEINSIVPPASLFSNVNSNNTQKFWAIGPLFGFNTSWNFLNEFSFIAEANFSLLWGEYTVKRLDLSADSGLRVNQKDRFDTLRFVPQYRVGIQWDSDFFCDLYHLSILVAWEEQQWINHNQMIYGPETNSLLFLNRNTNLNLYGLTLRTRLIF